MSKGKDLLAEAIAEAKVVRAAAIKNATKQLEENLTPSIKEMLANKLEEEMDLNEGNDEENIDENANSGFKEVKQKVNEEDNSDADDDADAADDDAADADAAADDADAAADDADAAADDADADADAADADADAADDDAADDDTPLKDITLGDLKQIVSDLVAAAAAPAPGGDMGADMDPGDVEGAGDETAPGDPAASAQADPNADALADPNADPNADPAAGDDDDEIDISEILRELEEEEKNTGKKDICPKCGQPKGSAACKEMCKENKQNDEMPENQNGKEHHKEPNENGPSQDSELDEIKKENEDLKKENQELREGLAKCNKVLKDVNLLNSKLSVTSKLLSRPNLSESQKANIIKTIDGAKSPKEALALGKTLVEGLKNSRKPINEHRGSASKPAGSSTASKKTDNELIDEGMVRRFQQLAGIIKD